MPLWRSQILYALRLSTLLFTVVSTLLFTVSFTLLASNAQAGEVVVYHSIADDGVAPGSTPILPGLPDETLYLYLDAGAVASAGTPCVDGEGDEVCAWEFVLAVEGSASLAAFVPDGQQDIVWSSSASELRATGGNAKVGELGPIRIGEVQLDVSAQNWSATLEIGSAVGADFALEDIDEEVVALPEPGFLLQLGCGVLFLSFVAARRGAGR
jgi:hypothetical protein